MMENKPKNPFKKYFDKGNLIGDTLRFLFTSIGTIAFWMCIIFIEVFVFLWDAINVAGDNLRKKVQENEMRKEEKAASK
jgi:hypothetical protein